MGFKKAVVEDELDTVLLERDYVTLLAELQSESVAERRDAVRELAAYPQSVVALLNVLDEEPDHLVREALLMSLQQIGGETVVSGLINLLRSEDAVLRNGAIEVLQSMPEGVALHMLELLNDQASDVRIFAIDILQQLAHPQAP